MITVCVRLLESKITEKIDDEIKAKKKKREKIARAKRMAAGWPTERSETRRPIINTAVLNVFRAQPI